MTGLDFLSVSSASALGAANTPRGMTCRSVSWSCERLGRQRDAGAAKGPTQAAAGHA